MNRYHPCCLRIMTVLLSLHMFPHMANAQAAATPFQDLRIDPRTEEDWKALSKEARSIHRELWEVPLYLLQDKIFEAAVPPRVMPQALNFDAQYFEHLGLVAKPDGESRATKSDSGVDAVMARYTIGKLKVETRQSVWVWGLWIPFNEQFQAADVPAGLAGLIPALKGKITRVTSEDGKVFYISESGPPDGHVLLRQAVATDTGVLLWGLKGNPLTSGVAMSPQIWLNRGWFRSAEIGRK